MALNIYMTNNDYTNLKILSMCVFSFIFIKKNYFAF